MNVFKLSAIAVAAVAISASNASAQREDQFAWSFGGGASIPTGNAADEHSTGAHGMGALGIGMVDSPWGIRFDGMYSSLGKKSRTFNTPGGTAEITQGSAKVFMLTANGLVNIYGSNTHIYALGGLGGYWYNPRQPGASSENDFMLQAGAGVWLNFANMFIEAKFANLYRALPDRATGKDGKRSMQVIPVTLGIIF